MLFRFARQTSDDGKPFVLEERPLLHVVHPGKWFAELPVGRV